MIDGYFKTLHPSVPPAPYLRAVVRLEGLNDPRRYVDFLVDTGADSTCVHPPDVLALDVERDVLNFRHSTESQGIGGSLRYIPHRALLIFDQDDGHVLWQCQIDICDIWSNPQSAAELASLPSLLGRDFLSLCNMQMNTSQGILSFDPILQPGLRLLQSPLRDIPSPE